MRLASYFTWSYWKYAVLSRQAGADFLAAAGALYLALELLDFFKIVQRESLPPSTFFLVLGTAVVWVLLTRRPVSRIAYKIPKKDFCYEIRIADLLDSKEDIVVSTNTTFDTDISDGLISPKSVQGQVLLRYFDGKTDELDKQIRKSLATQHFTEAISPGNKKRYPIGTVAKVSAHGKNFYFLAMAELNEHGNASTDLGSIQKALAGLWNFIARRGEIGDLAIPPIGTGRGRLELPRKKIIEMIAQSFADASRERVFANKLAIVTSPDDASKHEVNLYELRDFLTLSLHV
jgi:Domain of unknown function (DUF6430)